MNFTVLQSFGGSEVLINLDNITTIEQGPDNDYDKIIITFTCGQSCKIDKKYLKDIKRAVGIKDPDPNQKKMKITDVSGLVH